MLQRRVATMVAACLLPDESKRLIRDVIVALRAQEACNAAVDDTIAKSITPLIEQREAEGTAFVKRIGLALERQAFTLETGAENLCRFWSRIARTLARHETRERVTDERVADDLNGALDSYEVCSRCSDRQLVGSQSTDTVTNCGRRSMRASSQPSVTCAQGVARRRTKSHWLSDLAWC